MGSLRLRTAIGVAMAVCALGVLAAPALAKEKLQFGEFQASIVGKTISPESPATVTENKEDEPVIDGLKLGGITFGAVNEKEGKIEPETPCLKPPKITGKVTAEKSNSLLTEIAFKQCVDAEKTPQGIPWKAVSFKLGVRFIANETGEIGNAEGGIEIVKDAVEKFKGVNSECLVEIPQQFVPGNSEKNPEKFYEAVEYTPESEEVENWEKSKKLKEEFPTGVQDRIEIETTEKFKGIVSYVDTVPTGKPHGCVPTKGEESGKLVTEPGKWYGWTEFRNGAILMEAEGLEIKGGQLTFVPPA